MRVTILTQYYPPEAGAPQRRLSDLAMRLTRLGHRVQVLTGLPNYPGDRVFPEYTGRENTVEERDGIRVARVGLYVAPLQKTMLQRLRCYFSFAVNVARSGAKLLEATDIVFLESPPLTLAPAGVLLARRLRASLVCNVSDLWPKSAVEMGMLGPGMMLEAAEWLERWTYRSSAALTGQTEGICDSLRQLAPEKPVYLFPNGVDLDSYSTPVDTNAVRRRFGWQEDEFVAGYTGLFGHAQALGQLIDAARHLGPQDRIRIVLFGDGPCRGDLEARIAADPSLPVSIYPAQSPAVMPEIQAALDAGIVPLANQPVFEGARPSKMFEIMAAGRPVVLCASGEAVRVLQSGADGPAGIAVPPERPDELARALKTLTADAPACERMGASGKALVARDFDRAAIAKNLERFLLSVTESRSNGAGATR